MVRTRWQVCGQMPAAHLQFSNTSRNLLMEAVTRDRDQMMAMQHTAFHSRVLASPATLAPLLPPEVLHCACTPNAPWSASFQFETGMLSQRAAGTLLLVTSCSLYAYYTVWVLITVRCSSNMLYLQPRRRPHQQSDQATFALPPAGSLSSRKTSRCCSSSHRVTTPSLCLC